MPYMSYMFNSVIVLSTIFTFWFTNKRTEAHRVTCPMSQRVRELLGFKPKQCDSKACTTSIICYNTNKASEKEDRKSLKY